MAQIDTTSGLDDSQGEVDFKALKQRFLTLNQARLRLTRAALRGRQDEFLDLLPLLFHVNHPLLPGYASRTAPCGVWGYEPERKALNLAKALARSFAYKRPTRKQWPIIALYLMGSSGTIAHAEGSDFDIWLCHDPALGEEQCRQLRHKAQGIEQWATTLGLEVHFFLINPEKFRRGGLSALSSESSGSAQHGLLLDEFYRTAVLLQGQYPLWWLVPPDYEAAYDLYVAELQRKRLLYARDAIDFGGLAHIPAEEFFGATLWQISKGIDAPYKAILKLLLLESYARDYPAVELLSKRFKQAVYDGIVDPEALDPYVQMLEKVGDYLQRQNEPHRLALAQRCLYFKADIRLGDPVPARRRDWRRERLLELTRSWGWGRTDLLLMDAHKGWRVHRVLEERQALFQALSASYRFLSDFARDYAELSRISQQDLTTLGRKLYSAFERKAGKVEIITRGVEAQLGEPQLTLLEVVNEAENGWLLYNGAVPRERLQLETPLKRARSLVELLAWCHCNRITSPNTAYVVYSGHSNHSSREVESLLARIAQRFPLSLLRHGGIQEYAAAARLRQGEVFINSGVRLADSMMVTRNLAASGHTDPFHFGHQGESLLLSADLLTLNSWGEVIVHRYSGTHALAQVLCDYLKWYPTSQRVTPPPPGFYSGSTALGSALSQRLEGLFHDLVDHFYGEGAAQAGGYLVALGNDYCSLYFEGDVPRYEMLPGLAPLYAHLGRAAPHFRHLGLDARTLNEGFLPTLYAHNREGMVQCFIYPQGERAELYVLDEVGTLTHQLVPFHDEVTLLSQLSRFFEAVVQRINLQAEGGWENTIRDIEFYRLACDAIGRRSAERLTLPAAPPEGQYISLQVILEQDAGGTRSTLYCDGREFTALEHGQGVIRAAVQHLLARRRSGGSYPAYITDLSLEQALAHEEGGGRLQSSHYLRYKRRIEEQLNRAMER